MGDEGQELHCCEQSFWTVVAQLRCADRVSASVDLSPAFGDRAIGYQGVGVRPSNWQVTRGLFEGLLELG
jgi:hypothetical protein